MNSTQTKPDHEALQTPAGAFRPWRVACAVLVAAGLGLVGCNTTEGAGRDIQEAGSALEDAAD